MPEPILIIDFDPPGSAATRACLRAAGMPSAVATSQRAFSLALRATIPPIVILEPVLPGLDGFRVCEVLKKGVGGRVPIVVLASRQMAEEMFGARGRQAGADWILELPRDEPELVALCRDTLGPLPAMIDEPEPVAVPAAVRAAPTFVATPFAPGTTGTRVLEDLAEEDLDRILDSAFAGVAHAAAVDGPDVPARLSANVPAPPKPRPKPAKLKVEPPKARPEPPLFEVLDPRSTIPLARIPELEAAVEIEAPIVRDAPEEPPRPRHPPAAKRTSAAPAREGGGRSILRFLLLSLFVLGAGAAGYLTWEPAKPESSAGIGAQRDAAASGAAPLEGEMDGAAADEDKADKVSPDAAMPPEVTPDEPTPGEDMATGIAADGAQASPAPADETAAAPISEAAGVQPAGTPAPGDGEPEPRPIAVLKPPIPAPAMPDVRNRSLPEPIAGTQLDPLYPPAARDAGLAGRVRMAVTVAPDGTVADVAVLDESEPGAGFGRAAVAAVRQWRFRPAVRAGAPHTATVEIALQFNP